MFQIQREVENALYGYTNISTCHCLNESFSNIFIYPPNTEFIIENIKRRAIHPMECYPSPYLKWVLSLHGGLLLKIYFLHTSDLLNLN